ncbi:hypothetical protein JYK14_14540 [Siccirubricoccus sp. KC 17139]|uniref:Uncharacterized protein n=1 Tax=Siccirubricoccus soli TaxID=2899147 RepID=A0ABT1D871_9PROT|nr:hypothetical protein [Siccirubricoccus soli]MCO6417374.1 hypothetical protein [Siccirubricoccus soli]MCP2683509.1 hypothetical protein [Siccirubricoccus soli]
MSRETAEFAYDLHAGLSVLQVPEFDHLQVIGMSATLAVHLKGLGEIDYEVLRKVSDHFMSIPSYALRPVLELLAEIEFVRLLTTGRTITKIVPNIPLFDDVYEGIGEYAAKELTLNGHEQATLAILENLYKAPRNRDALFNRLGMEKGVFDRCVTLGTTSGIVAQHTARGKNILISPYYFADNLDGLADLVAGAGTPALESALQKVKDNQGWPLSLVRATGEIGGVKLSSTEAKLVEKLAAEGIVKPPTIRFGGRTESFLFTPKPGATRLNAANREIYERAMALISAVRKGQLLPNAYRIRSPVRILESLRDNGYLRGNSEARDQYHNLIVLRVAHLKQTATDRWQLHLNRTQENEAALSLAIQLLRSGTMANMEVDQEARIALSKDEEYIQSLISAAELKKRQKQVTDAQAAHEFEQLILKLD